MSICDNLESIFGSDVEALTSELESLLESSTLTQSEKDELAHEASERGWL